MHWRPQGPLNTVVVTLKTGASLRGVLVDARRDKLILRAAAITTSDPNGNLNLVPLDGDIVVPMDNVDFYQRDLEPVVLDQTN